MNRPYGDTPLFSAHVVWRVTPKRELPLASKVLLALLHLVC